MSHIQLPMRSRAGGLHGFALIDEADVALVEPLGGWCIVARRYVGRWASGGGTQLMHRLLLGLEAGDSRCADHINGNPLDNRRSNLRIVSVGQNRQNVRSARGASSRFRGVSLVRGRFHAFARMNGRQHFLGSFADEFDAALAAQAWRDEHMPFAQPDPALLEVLEGQAA